MVAILWGEGAIEAMVNLNYGMVDYPAVFILLIVILYFVINFIRGAFKGGLPFMKKAIIGTFALIFAIAIMKLLELGIQFAFENYENTPMIVLASIFTIYGVLCLLEPKFLVNIYWKFRKRETLPSKHVFISQVYKNMEDYASPVSIEQTKISNDRFWEDAGKDKRILQFLGLFMLFVGVLLFYILFNE